MSIVFPTNYGDATTYVIRESTNGSFSAPQNILSLAGRALPYRPFELDGEMRAESTWYPGNPIASLQMLGSKENETRCNGFWKDRFIQSVTDDGLLVNPPGVAQWNGTQVADVFTLVQNVDGIRTRGQLIEVTWDEITRYGYLKRFVQKWNNRHDVEWEMTFDWISKDQPQAPVALPASIQQQDLGTQLRNALATMNNLITPPFEAAEDFLTTITDAQIQITNAVNDVTNAGINVTSSNISPQEQASRTLAALNNITSNADDIVTAIESRTPQSIINQPDPALLTLGDVLQASLYSRQLKDNCRDFASLSSDQGQKLQVQVNQTDIIATFIARQNMDLRDIANTYYGTQEQWHQIALFNGFISSALPAGQVVFVPRLTAAGV